MKKLFALCTALLIGACGGGGGGTSNSATGEASQPSGIPSSSQGDALVALATGELANRSLPVQGGLRQYSVFRPNNPLHQKRPLVIWFHGAGGIVWPGIRNDYWVQLAGRENFVLLEPQAISDQYAPYTYWNAGVGAPKDDVHFIEAALDAVIADSDIDTDRIYIGGMSSGGHMAFYMALKLRERVAAVAPIAGAIAYTPDVIGSYALQRPMPLLNIHGTADTIVNMNGGDWYTSWGTIRDVFLKNNQITHQPTVINLADVNPDDGSTVTKYEYRGATVASDIDDYRVNGGSHSVPGIESSANQDFNAYEVIWTFFKKHKLSDAK